MRAFRTTALIGAASVALSAASAASAQEQSLSTSSYGVPGLIDMPSARMQPDGELVTSVAILSNGVARTQLSFQLTPRIQGVFRYATLPDFLPVGSGFIRTYDRSFDFRYQLFREGRLMPAVTVGLQDFGGTGIYSGEYLVATKTINDQLTVTGGIGWGRLGTNGSFSNPLSAISDRFDTRPGFVPGSSGGEFSTGQWFRGDAALFAGVEYRPTDRWTLKAEYSSDAYLEEEARGIFTRKTPLNFGVEYRVNDGINVGAYVLGGSEVGLNLQFGVNPKRPPQGSGRDPAPRPVTVRPARSDIPEAWTTVWVGNEAVETAVGTTLDALMTEAGLELIGYDLSADRAEVRFRNPTYISQAQAMGRAVRAMSAIVPASVETFVLIPETATSLAGGAVVLRRSDIEALENSPNGAAEVLAVAGLVDAVTVRDQGRRYTEDAYPRFNWNLGPYFGYSLFDPDDPLRYDIGAELSASWEPVRGMVVEGALRQRIVGNRDESNRPSNSVLPRVRTDTPEFLKTNDPFIPYLTAEYFFRPGKDLYARTSAGLLEDQFGGVSAELLWKPVASPLAIGLEVNQVRQRDFDGLLGFQDLDATTAFVSAYYDHGNRFFSQVDVGQYLAGDRGATYRLTREFSNGWQVGAFATMTNVSAEDFGEGSFDKGIFLSLPVSWLTGRPSRDRAGVEIKPIQRDGGARLNLRHRLYPQVRDLSDPQLGEQWGRFWR
ncbi:YjbH domain-containing protein [Jannaschia sp. 2305UL9-9]|uniref:YjbH domain-containing protein n=1 Tax=Jannaschia sp. 2305UL9-9 TaxID=3121638 RepID=UPI003529AEA8